MIACMLPLRLVVLDCRARLCSPLCVHVRLTVHSLTDAEGEHDYVELSPMDMERIAQVELEHAATLPSPLKDPTPLQDSSESSDAAWMADVSLTPQCASGESAGATTLPHC